ncbi:pyrimidine/purine nucleoside phosphorylase [Stieleria sp. TO1_6]|uniref:pyrimidine/purine nucleoside phosphorylase n=1 Tax=Stieleria tagensis TaxID=2956795 RepID=UPI00209ABAF5|nr:pyrimidine/purine nucleoside phosphorylase [Stieleria tagensis]MCO8125481.1 pyrimidine/purine nucleoside phosphorylase [Stieleria tagensis]
MQVNEYFDGNVKSISFENSEGRVTSGVMSVGEYEFQTSEPERMKVISGELLVNLQGAEEFIPYSAGTEFRVAKGVKFMVKVEQSTAYLCFYG